LRRLKIRDAAESNRGNRKMRPSARAPYQSKTDTIVTMHKLKKIVENPWVNLAVAGILAATALSELGDTLWEDLANGNARGHHGILLYALLSGLKAIPDLFEASKYISGE